MGLALAALWWLCIGSSRATAEELVPACPGSLRLSAVAYDGKRVERSFAVFGVGPEQRPQVFRRGARIAGYEVTSIEPGAVLLSTPKQACSVRLRGAEAERELRAISVAAVRGALRARKVASLGTDSRAAALARAP